MGAFYVPVLADPGSRGKVSQKLAFQVEKRITRAVGLRQSTNEREGGAGKSSKDIRAVGTAGIVFGQRSAQSEPPSSYDARQAVKRLSITQLPAGSNASTTLFDVFPIIFPRVLCN